MEDTLTVDIPTMEHPIVENENVADLLARKEEKWGSIKQSVYKNFLEESNADTDQLLDAITAELKNQSSSPEAGENFDWTYKDKMLLFGEKLTQGQNNVIYINRQTQQVTHLWRYTRDEKQKTQNQHQMEVYRDNAGKSPQFQFTREVPGGWMEPEIEHQGDLKDYIKKRGSLTTEQVEQAVSDLREMQRITGEAHGDLVKRKDFVADFNVDLIQRSYDDVEPYGYINYQNILVSPEGKIIIRDYAGNPDPTSIGGWDGQDRNNVRSKVYMENELQFFEEGLRSLLPKDN